MIRNCVTELIPKSFVISVTLLFTLSYCTSEKGMSIATLCFISFGGISMSLFIKKLVFC